MTLRAWLATTVILAAAAYLLLTVPRQDLWWALEAGRPAAPGAVLLQPAAAAAPLAVPRTTHAAPHRARGAAPETAASSQPQLTVITFNIRFARRADGRLDLPAVAELLQRHDPDVVALQKVERFSPRSGFVDQARWLAAALDMELLYGPSLSLGPAAYGNAILSRHPMEPAGNHVLPSRLEPRALLEAQLETPLGSLRVFNTHLGLNAKEREIQARAMLHHVAQSSVPVIVAGDWNAGPQHPEVTSVAAHYTDAIAAGAAGDEPGYTIAFNSEEANRRIDYIFVDPRLRVRTAYVVPEWISNHYPVVAVLEPLTAR